MTQRKTGTEETQLELELPDDIQQGVLVNHGNVFNTGNWYTYYCPNCNHSLEGPWHVCPSCDTEIAWEES